MLEFSQILRRKVKRWLLKTEWSKLKEQLFPESISQRNEQQELPTTWKTLGIRRHHIHSLGIHARWHKPVITHSDSSTPRYIEVRNLETDKHMNCLFRIVWACIGEILRIPHLAGKPLPSGTSAYKSLFIGTFSDICSKPNYIHLWENCIMCIIYGSSKDTTQIKGY